MLKDILNQFKQSAPQPAPQPEPIPAPPEAAPTPPQPAPERPLPTAGHKPTQVAGYTQGDEVTAAVSAKTCPHPKMLFITVPDWDGLAVTYVQDKRDWRPSDRMIVKFARMRPDYTLEFDGPRGPHRNKFGRRPA